MDLVFTAPPPPETPLRAAIRDAHRPDETAAVAAILAAYGSAVRRWILRDRPSFSAVVTWGAVQVRRYGMPATF